jgi:hypothetical protein
LSGNRTTLLCFGHIPTATSVVLINIDLLALEDYMGNRKTIVVTAYGHSKTIDKIAVCF